MHRTTKTVLPIIIIILGVGVAWQLMANSPKVKRSSVSSQAPMVKTVKVTPENIRIPVYTQGTVQPRTSISLAAEITGRIVKTSSQFASGGFFSKDEILVSIDPEEYKLAITRAEATVASARQQLARAEAEHKQKVEEYRNVSPNKVTDFALRKPEYEEAKARLKAAMADLQLAQLQLRRCEIRAPFDGRITEKFADTGQYITPGAVLAKLYAIDVAEIRLPISHSQTKLLDVSALTRKVIEEQAVPVTVRGFYAGRQHQWQGQIVRTDAKLDDLNRLLYLVAQVDNPYGIQANIPGVDQPERSILAAGMFVKAEIPGRLLNDIFILPRTALHGQDTVWLLDESLRLYQRTVQVVHRDENKVYIDNGLQSGDTIITSPLDAVVDGMQLRTAS